MAVERVEHTLTHPIHLPEDCCNLILLEHAVANRQGRVDERLSDARRPPSVHVLQILLVRVEDNW